MPITPNVIDKTTIDSLIIEARFRCTTSDEHESMQYLFSPDGQQAIADNIITLNQYLRIPWYKRESMKHLFSPDGRQAIADGIITLERYLQIPYLKRDSMRYLFSPDGRRAMGDGIITLERYLKIPSCERKSMEYLFSPDGRQAITDGIITLERYLKIPEDERDDIKHLVSPNNQNDRQAITDGIITLERYLQISKYERKSMTHLFSPDGRRAMGDGIITLERYLKIPYHDRESMQYLFSPDGRRAVDDGVITLEQYLEIPRDKRESMTHLFSPDGRRAMGDGIITIAQYLQFGCVQRESLKYLFSPDGRRAMGDGIITLERYLQIPCYEHEDVITALQDPDTRQRIINGQITIENIIGVRHHAHAIAVPNFNGAQSTHTTSVHESTSESATRLANRYKSKIGGAGLENTIEKAQTYINSLNDSEKNKAVKNGFSRIVAPDYTFTDSSSQVSLRQLLALTFLAIHDGENRFGSLEDAQMQFVEALYEIQRGYNLSDSGIDEGGTDQYICPPGTFNKLIERLHGIHPDCQIRFVTRDGASRKLPIIVREEAMRYLTRFANLNTAEALTTFTRLKEDGVETIWEHIKDNIATRIFDEFGSLYQDRADSNFTALIEAGKDAELDAVYIQIVLQLDKLEHILASCKVSNIVFKLRALTQDYFIEKKIDSSSYKEKALDIIHQAQPELAKHRDYKQILVNLLILIASLGTAQLINKACTGNFLFFNHSDSLKKLDDLRNIIEKEKLCYFNKPA